MKKLFNNSQRAKQMALTSGLLLSLGFSLSWNPEYFSLARYDFVKANSTMLASESDIANAATKGVHMGQGNSGSKAANQQSSQASKDAKSENGLKSIDLSKFKNAKGSVEYATSEFKDENGKSRLRAMVIYTEGQGDCQNCNFSKELDLGEFSNKVAFIEAKIIAAILDEVNNRDSEKARVKTERADAREGEREADAFRGDEVDPGDCDVYTDREELAERISCHSEQLQKEIAACEKAIEKEAKEENARRKHEAKNEGKKRHKHFAKEERVCRQYAERYKKKYLKSALKAGLAAPFNSEAYNEAISVSSDLLSMESRYAKIFSRDISDYAFKGLVAQAFMACNSRFTFDMNLFQNSLGQDSSANTGACMRQFIGQTAPIQSMRLSRSIDGCSSNSYGFWYCGMRSGESLMDMRLDFQNAYVQPLNSLIMSNERNGSVLVQRYGDLGGNSTALRDSFHRPAISTNGNQIRSSRGNLGSGRNSAL